MEAFAESSEPIFIAVSRIIANGILNGTYPVGSQVPSTTELAAFFKINPITAGRALTELTERGILEKRRGVGTFVTQQADELLRGERIEELNKMLIDPLLQDSRLLGISLEELIATIRERDAIVRSEHTAILTHERKSND
ncbi:GntR family transcriptional regulator [Bifidobacterium crudilactis]|uniref:GntR family transcriptional regulator n=1 Tax=Bifidobacterium crudilactis TaxID=327277 RepID=UPI002354C67A|nr:GntR family transcriptional regulator [Bifidobacterium crudilactis]